MNLYSMRNLDSIIYYLKLNMMRDRKTRIIYFTQTVAIDRILEEIEIAECLFCITFMKSDLQLKGVQESFQIVNEGIYI
jgi:hypothetical protein